MLVFTFDLDDTLFSEKEYIRSGFSKVSEFLVEKFNLKENPFPLMWNIFLEGERKFVFNKTLERLKIKYSEELIQKMIKIYREHTPNIKLYPDARFILEKLHFRRNLALITDGPLISQKNKVKALKIEKYMNFIVYTEELGKNYSKPHILPYKKVMEFFKVNGNQCAYIGDNSQKDFEGAKKLGWLTIQIEREEGLYKNICKEKAHFKIKSLFELFYFM